jgi:hypothetical protein
VWGVHPQRFSFWFVGLAYKGKDIVFRFIIEYSTLMGFGPYVVVGQFLYEDFGKMIFSLVLILEISYRVMISSWRIWFFSEGFVEDYVFAWWNIWISIILLLPYDTFECKWQVLHTPGFRRLASLFSSPQKQKKHTHNLPTL